MSIISNLNEEEKGKFLEDLTWNVKQIQDDMLTEILTLNAKTEYLQWFLHGSSAIELFKKNVPIVTYEDVKPYIDRVVKGDSSNIISALPVTRFLLSSGTSGGTQNMIPANNRYLEGYALIHDIRMHVISKHVKGLEKGKGMMFYSTCGGSETSDGLPIANATSSYLRSDYFKNRPSNWYYSYTSPDEVILGSDMKQNLYCHFLCGLVQRDEVVRTGSTFASSLVRAIKVLEDSWKELCSNIRSGQLSEWITDSGCRNSVSIVLGGQPRPELADKIEKICNQNSWKGILTRIWPQTRYIETIITGSLAQYVPTLKYYCNDLPIISTTYACSEAIIGVNMDPLCKPEDVSYTFMPNLAYFEFIPMEGDKGDVVDLADVKLGCCYQFLVTSSAGLYRMRVGDVVQVTGFHNKAPQFRFVRREKAVLSIHTEKTNEQDLFRAVNRAKLVLDSAELGFVDFTSYADISTAPGHYVIYLEVEARNEDIKKKMKHLELNEKTFLECCLVMEDSLCGEYKVSRLCGAIGPLEIRVVSDGTFDSLMDFFSSMGASISQYKTPRSVKAEKALQVLETNVVARFSNTL